MRERETLICFFIRYG